MFLCPARSLLVIVRIFFILVIRRRGGIQVVFYFHARLTPLGRNPSEPLIILRHGGWQPSCVCRVLRSILCGMLQRFCGVPSVGSGNRVVDGSSGVLFPRQPARHEAAALLCKPAVFRFVLHQSLMLRLLQGKSRRLKCLLLCLQICGLLDLKDGRQRARVLLPACCQTRLLLAPCLRCLTACLVAGLRRTPSM